MAAQLLGVLSGAIKRFTISGGIIQLSQRTYEMLCVSVGLCSCLSYLACTAHVLQAALQRHVWFICFAVFFHTIS